MVKGILDEYEKYLKANNAIDFSDMINMAADIVSHDYSIHPYQWIIIDEFQDISVARYHLINAILKKTGAKLLCVGDDWQSIYRFAGSDISLFTEFQKYFGNAEIIAIEKTYRNSQQLIDVAGEFISRNQKQIKKSLRSEKSIKEPIVFVGYQNNPFAALEKTIQEIICEFGTQSSIMLLGRTQYDFEMIKESQLFEIHGQEKLTLKSNPSVPFSFLTVHKSKGLEADNVILLNFQNATLGFPNKIADDPVLELVLTHGDNYTYAEERRLLYVAFTRTKNKIYILTDENKPSEFMEEFKNKNSIRITSEAETAKENIICPRCKTGKMIIRKNESSNLYFVGCTNYPNCDYTVDDTRIMIDTKMCPACGGFLVKRKGRYGIFYGCTNYPLCNHTEELMDNKQP